MSWVSIGKMKCNTCGLCVLRCAGVYSKVDGEIVARADASNCIACGLCISLCTTQAIVHSEMNTENLSGYARNVVAPGEMASDSRSL